MWFLLTKARLGVCFTHIMVHLPEDDMEHAIKEIVEGEDYMNDERWVEAAVTESFERVKVMI